MKYAWIREHRDSFPIFVACDVLEVSTSGYYAWFDRASSPRARRTAPSARRFASVHARHLRQRQDRGDARPARLIWIGLPQHGGQGDAGIGPEKPRVAGLHADHDAGRSDQAAGAQPPCQDFTAEAPNRKWVTDITYLSTERRLGLPGRRARPVQPQGHRLGARHVAGDGIGKHRSAAGHRSAATRERRAFASQRSRLSVHQRRLSADLARRSASSVR